MNPDNLETMIIRFNQDQLIEYLMMNRYLKNEMRCNLCGCYMKYVVYKRNIDGKAYRCMEKNCKKYKKYNSIRLGSFFENFTIELYMIMRVVIKYSTATPRHSIVSSLNLDKSTVYKVIERILDRMPLPDFHDHKLGGPGFIVQIDETMMNYKCKSHRGRSPSNRTDALCIIEMSNSIVRAFACVIPDKKAETILPIITRNVANGSTIHTDEHRSYSQLGSIGYNHDTVCHKYEFVAANGVNTQAIESFNNIIKVAVKNRKGVATEKRGVFLKEICFLFNNRNLMFESIINLIKF